MFHGNEVKSRDDIYNKEPLEKSLETLDVVKQGFSEKQRSLSADNLSKACQLPNEISESDDESTKLCNHIALQVTKLSKEKSKLESKKLEADRALEQFEENRPLNILQRSPERLASPSSSEFPCSEVSRLPGTAVLVLQKFQENPKAYKKELCEYIKSKNGDLELLNEQKKDIIAEFRKLIAIEGSIFKEFGNNSGNDIHSIIENEQSKKSIFNFKDDKNFSVIQNLQINALRVKDESFDYYHSQVALRYIRQQLEKIDVEKEEKILRAEIDKAIAELEELAQADGFLKSQEKFSNDQHILSFINQLNGNENNKRQDAIKASIKSMMLYADKPNIDNNTLFHYKERKTLVSQYKYCKSRIEYFYDEKWSLEHKVKNISGVEIIGKAEKLSEQLEVAKKEYRLIISQLQEAEKLCNQAYKILSCINYKEAKEKVDSYHKRYEVLNTKYEETVKDLDNLRKISFQIAKNKEYLGLVQFIRNIKKQEQYKYLEKSYNKNIQLLAEKDLFNTKESQRKDRTKKITCLKGIIDKVRKEDFNISKEVIALMQKDEKMSNILGMIKCIEATKKELDEKLDEKVLSEISEKSETNLFQRNEWAIYFNHDVRSLSDYGKIAIDELSKISTKGDLYNNINLLKSGMISMKDNAAKLNNKIAQSRTSEDIVAVANYFMQEKTNKYKKQVFNYINEALLDTKIGKDNKCKKSVLDLKGELRKLCNFLRDLTGYSYERIKIGVSILPIEHAAVKVTKLYETAINLSANSKATKKQLNNLRDELNGVKELINRQENERIDGIGEILDRTKYAYFDQLIEHYDSSIKASLAYVEIAKVLSQPISKGYQIEKEDIIKVINTIKLIYELENKELKGEITATSKNIDKISKEQEKLTQTIKNLSSEIEKYTNWQEKLENQIKDHIKTRNRIKSKFEGYSEGEEEAPCDQLKNLKLSIEDCETKRQAYEQKATPGFFR